MQREGEPVEDGGEGGEDGGGDEVGVDEEDEAVHPLPEGGHGEDVHTGKPRVQEHQTDVGLRPVDEAP